MASWLATMTWPTERATLIRSTGLSYATKPRHGRGRGACDADFGLCCYLQLAATSVAIRIKPSCFQIQQLPEVLPLSGALRNTVHTL